MRGPVARKFTLLDAMVLVAATAVGLGWFVAEHGPELREIRAFSDDWFGRLRRVVTVLALSIPFAVSWTSAVLALRLRRPRPSRPRLACQPGAVACAVALMAFAVQKVLRAVSVPVAYCLSDPRTWSGWADDWERSGRDLHVMIQLPGFAVLASWLVLRLGGRWRAERSWVDRAGRALGLWWVVLILLHLGMLLMAFGFIGEGGQLD